MKEDCDAGKSLGERGQGVTRLMMFCQQGLEYEVRDIIKRKVGNNCILFYVLLFFILSNLIEFIL